MKTQRVAKIVLYLIPQCFFVKIPLRPCGKIKLNHNSKKFFKILSPTQADFSG